MIETKLIRGWNNKLPKYGERGAVFGNFDGLHLGHQALIKDLISWKNLKPNRQAFLISLYPHPSKILKGRQIKQILSLQQTVSVLSRLNVDYWQMLRFSKNTAEMSASQFINQVFIKLCQLDYLVIGPDAAVGKDRTGQVDFIKSELDKSNCQVTIVSELQLNGAKVGSRYVRAAIEAGDPQRAKDLLGRSYTIQGKVKRGDARGRQLGFRTANICLVNYVVPEFGVYLVRANLQKQEYAAVANVGVRPTFGTSQAVLEVHLLDYQGLDFYGQQLSVEFIKRLRPEKKFSGIDELRTQISQDVLLAKTYFGID